MLRRTVLSCVLFLLPFAGCAVGPAQYQETHELERLTVIFMDEKSLHRKWRSVTGEEAVFFTPDSDPAQRVTLRRIKGFYDFRTHTIYCSKMDFLTCGHELHHATMGRFHVD